MSFQHLEIPLDEDDCRYHQSFAADQIETQAARDFFQTYGFTIVRDVLDAVQIAEQVRDMDICLQEHGKGLSHFGMPRGVNALFRPALLQLRQSPHILRALAAALGVPMADLIVSHDRWLLHAPATDPTKPLTTKNLHLDFNPWEYFDEKAADAVQQRLDSLSYAGTNPRGFIAENNDIHQSFGPAVQAIVNLSDLTDTQCGGTIVVPGSHLQLQSVLFGPDNPQIGTTQRRAGPMQYKFPDCSMGKHVRMRPGSLLVWDQRVVHGSTPNLNPNQFRRAIPIRAFRRHVLSKQRARERDRAVSTQVQACEFEPHLTELGRRVFGLDP